MNLSSNQPIEHETWFVYPDSNPTRVNPQATGSWTFSAPSGVRGSRHAIHHSWSQRGRCRRVQHAVFLDDINAKL